jgi:hypothetical protein
MCNNIFWFGVCGIFLTHPERELDLVELAIFGDIKKTNSVCECKTLGAFEQEVKKFGNQQKYRK